MYEPERTLKNLVALAHGELRFHPVRSTVEGERLLRKVGTSKGISAGWLLTSCEFYF